MASDAERKSKENNHVGCVRFNESARDGCGICAESFLKSGAITVCLCLFFHRVQSNVVYVHTEMMLSLNYLCKCFQNFASAYWKDALQLLV